uniref:Uncharacterized protein n=1 Tax=Peromyscus maniculatus bairdii TaxID=230844 RepID=A0A8C8ULI9_PERMB
MKRLVLKIRLWKPTNGLSSQLEINFGDLGHPGHGGCGHGSHPNCGSRTGKSSASAPDVDDPEAFPALAQLDAIIQHWFLCGPSYSKLLLKDPKLLRIKKQNKTTNIHQQKTCHSYHSHLKTELYLF